MQENEMGRNPHLQYTTVLYEYSETRVANTMFDTPNDHDRICLCANQYRQGSMLGACRHACNSLGDCLDYKYPITESLYERCLVLILCMKLIL
jgi:hypothetical protein